MGTETVYRPMCIIQIQILVKLNNPLMGTETFHDILLYCFAESCAVKLNNPLMGTETPFSSNA